MPILILMSGAAVITWAERLFQVTEIYDILLIFICLGAMTGAGIVATLRELWKP